MFYKQERRVCHNAGDKNRQKTHGIDGRRIFTEEENKNFRRKKQSKKEKQNKLQVDNIIKTTCEELQSPEEHYSD